MHPIFRDFIWGKLCFRIEEIGWSASAYGKCVATHAVGPGDLKKDVCSKEFEMLMDCFTKAVTRNKPLGGSCYHFFFAP
uniref:NADH:ubiquinone oxidoreductase complex assembly factor 8 n=1 Tax=Anolis carolinensis TaxID=28377 RepID=A0A803TU85_ANOCA